MFIDTEVSAGVLADLIRRRVRGASECFAQPLAFPLHGYLLDHIDVGLPTFARVLEPVSIRVGDGSTVDVSGHRVRVHVPLFVFLATETDVVDGGLDGPASPMKLTLTVDFDLVGEVQADSNGVVTAAGVRVLYAGKDAVLPEATLDQKVDDTLAAVGDLSPIDLSPLAEALDTTVHIRNLCVATNAARTRVVIRVEVEDLPADPAAAWASFFASPPSRLSGKDWAVVIDKALIIAVIEDRLAKSISDSDKVELLEGPEAQWLGPLGIPGAIVSAYVDVVEACPTGQDIGCELSSTMLLSLADGPAGQELASDVNVTWNLIDSDVLLCGITSGVAGGFLGAVIGAAAGPIGAVVGFVVGMVAVTIVVTIGADLYDPDEDQFVQKDCEVIEHDDDHIQMACSKPLSLPPTNLLGALVPDSLAGHLDGLLLSGTLTVNLPETTLIVNPTSMNWDQSLNCNTKNVDVAQTGSAELLASGLSPLKVCRADSLGDDLDFFIPTIDVQGTYKTTIKVSLKDEAADAYFANPPYPCRLLVQTSIGARMVDLGLLPERPAPPDPFELIEAVATHCLKAYDKFWNTKFNPKWLVDPPPESNISLQLWDVAASGLHPNDILEVATPNGSILDEVVASPSGIARALIVAPPTTKALSLRRRGPEQALPNESDRLLAITQTTLVRESQIVLPSVCLELLVARANGQHLLVAVTTAGIHTWELRTGRGLALAGTLLDPELIGAIPAPGGCITYGPTGILRLRFPTAGGIITSAELIGVSARDVTLNGSRVSVLTDDGVLSLDQELRPVERIQQPVGAGTSSTADAPQETATSNHEQEPLPDSRGKTATAPRTRIRVVSDKPRHWFDSAIRLKGHIAHLEPNHRRVNLYRPWSKRQLTSPFTPARQRRARDRPSRSKDMSA